MEFIRKHRKFFLILAAILIILIGLSSIFGRYLYNYVNNYILETKEFYFNSSVLKMNTSQYRINNWDGVNAYTLTIDLNNRKNVLKKTDVDIEYVTEVTCKNGITCTTSKTSGTIVKDLESDSFQVQVVPQRRYEAGEEIEINIKARSTSPYTKELSATYYLRVVENDYNYNIEDEENQNYLVLNFINSLTFYQVNEAFGTYSVNDIIGLEDYNDLSAADKEKTFSAIVTLKFDPHEVILDMTNTTYIHRIPNSEKTVNIDGHKYITEYSYKALATSSDKILFYKNDRTKNYTYPINTSESIVKVTAKLAGK